MASNQVIILTIDGGGIRGIIPAYILAQLEQQTKRWCYEMFDIIGGTSTGGIIAAGLSKLTPQDGSYPLPASTLLKMYQTLLPVWEVAQVPAQALHPVGYWMAAL